MTLTATCHCGATRITLPGPPAEAKTCNCSYCQRAGAVWGYYAPEDLRIEASSEDKVYSASDGVNQHHFCGKCGGQTHGFSPDWASVYNNDGTLKPGATDGIPSRQTAAVNLNMIDGLSLSAITITAVDGRNSW